MESKQKRDRKKKKAAKKHTPAPKHHTMSTAKAPKRTSY